VPLKYQLKSGDNVEIITTDAPTPSKDWLKLVKTGRAKERIRSWIKTQQRRRSLEVGTEISSAISAAKRLELGKAPARRAARRSGQDLGFKMKSR